MEPGLYELYKIYESNIKKDNNVNENDMNPIKIGDILVALYNNKEVRGEVSSICEDYYILRGKNGSELKVTIDNVYEHYPKNRTFENKTSKKLISENQYLDKEETINNKPVKKTKKNIDEFDKDNMKNSPENQVDLSIENIKTIGKVVYYPSNIKHAQIEKLFEKGILSKEKHWYSMTEKENEIHIIRNNDKAFEIQSFINSLISHFLKSQNQLIKENYSKIKVTGNNNFSIISNIPPDIKKQLINNIIGLLTK